MDEIKHEFKNDEHKPWKSCCFELDSHFVAYLGQYVFSLATLSFCTIMLIKADGDCNKSSSYINIISFMLGKLLSSVMTSSEK